MRQIFIKTGRSNERAIRTSIKHDSRASKRARSDWKYRGGGQRNETLQIPENVDIKVFNTGSRKEVGPNLLALLSIKVGVVQRYTDARVEGRIKNLDTVGSQKENSLCESVCMSATYMS